HADDAAFQVGDAVDFRPRYERVDRVVELCGDRYRVRAVQCGAHQEWGGDVRDVDSIVVQRVDHAVGAAGNRDHDPQVDSLATEEPFALRERHRDGIDALVR